MSTRSVSRASSAIALLVMKAFGWVMWITPIVPRHPILSVGFSCVYSDA